MIKKEEKYLVEAGYPPAVRMAEKDMDNNACAHMNAKSFVKADGSYGTMDMETKPQFQDLPMNWASADTNKV